MKARLPVILAAAAGLIVGTAATWITRARLKLADHNTNELQHRIDEETRRVP